MLTVSNTSSLLIWLRLTKILLFSNERKLMYKEINDRSSGRAILGVGLRPLAMWDCGFESLRKHGCLS